MPIRFLLTDVLLELYTPHGHASAELSPQTSRSARTPHTPHRRADTSQRRDTTKARSPLDITDPCYTTHISLPSPHIRYARTVDSRPRRWRAAHLPHRSCIYTRARRCFAGLRLSRCSTVEPKPLRQAPSLSTPTVHVAAATGPGRRRPRRRQGPGAQAPGWRLSLSLSRLYASPYQLPWMA